MTDVLPLDPEHAPLIRSGDPAAAATRDRIASSIASPLGFPPIEAAIVPGDRIAIAVDVRLPDLVEFTRVVVDTLNNTGPDGIDVVLGDEADDELVATLRQTLASSAVVHRHDSSHRDHLRFLMVDSEDLPIYLNRHLVDADFVLPLSAAAYVRSPGDRLPAGDGAASQVPAADDHDPFGLFPVLADAATRIRWARRCRTAAAGRKSSRVAAQQCRHDSMHMGWTLGVQVMMRAIVGTDGGIQDVVAGTPPAIDAAMRRDAQDDLNGGPDAQTPSGSSLVIASLDGDARQQTWDNIARAAVAASRLAKPEGTLVIWSGIGDVPDSLSDQLRSDADDDIDDRHPDRDDLPVRDVNADGFPDWPDHHIAAWRLRPLLRRFRILLHGNLPGERIEQLGLGFVAGVDELNHLIRSHRDHRRLPAAHVGAYLPPASIDTT